MTEVDEREAVVAEVTSWLGTPYHEGADIKGVGVDCGMLLIRVFQATGHVPSDFEPRPYPSQWHMHQSAERYLGYVQSFAHELPPDTTPGPGDIILFKFGKCFSHGAIVVDWPRCIHAMSPLQVNFVDVTGPRIKKLERRLFSVWPK